MQLSDILTIFFSLRQTYTHNKYQQCGSISNKGTIRNKSNTKYTATEWHFNVTSLRMLYVLEALELRGLDILLLKEANRDLTSAEKVLKLGLDCIALALWRWNLQRRQRNNKVSSKWASLEWISERKIIVFVICSNFLNHKNNKIIYI